MLLAILLLVSLVALLPLASADPSDPAWLVGIYDEADGDFVVWLVDRMELTIHPEAASVALSVPPRLCAVPRTHLLQSSLSSRLPLVHLPLAGVMAFRLPSPFTSSALGSRSPPYRHSTHLT
ncbi:MAG: hypothetical protein DMD83_21940 [Candidatus Rokuibacteriota bacterium]|nr:MAG: hypothetical protein DMD83_21940 [Candidatus Rokubacteria bacterium]